MALLSLRIPFRRFKKGFFLSLALKAIGQVYHSRQKRSSTLKFIVISLTVILIIKWKMELSVQRFRSPEHYHQSNLQTVRHTTSTNSLSHRQTKTQEHPFLKPVLNTRAEEASGDGQLNDRVIDSLNHVDVQFFGHLSIWDWHFSVFSLPLSSMLSVRRSIHCPLPAASPLSYFYPLLYSYLPFSFVFCFFLSHSLMHGIFRVDM